MRRVAATWLAIESGSQLAILRPEGVARTARREGGGNVQLIAFSSTHRWKMGASGDGTVAKRTVASTFASMRANVSMTRWGVVLSASSKHAWISSSCGGAGGA